MKDFVDDLYKRASEDPDIPFNEQAWERMEEKLELAARKRRRGLLWIFFLLFILISGGLIWGIQKTPELPIPKTKKQEGPIAKKSPVKSPTGSKKPERGDLELTIPAENSKTLAEEGATKRTEKKHTTPGIAPSQLVANTTASKTTQLPAIKKHPSTQKQKSALSATTPAIVSNPKRPVPNEELVSTTVNAKNQSKKDSAINRPQLEEAFSAISTLAQVWPSDPLLSDAVNIDVLAPIATEPIAYDTEPVRAKKNSWGLGLTAGPDLASVNANGRTAYGLNAGLALDYRLGRRFVFQATGQYLLKNYVADQREYVAPKGFWINKAYPNYTEGTCDMLQWSVDLRYNWWVKPKWSTFVSVGSSSWTLLNEKYEFYYTTYTHGQVNHWESSKNKNYWLSIAQVGIGFERMLRPGLSLQVNWTGQVPLQGVGGGKVEIYTGGLGIMVHKQMGKMK